MARPLKTYFRGSLRLLLLIPVFLHLVIIGSMVLCPMIERKVCHGRSDPSRLVTIVRLTHLIITVVPLLLTRRIIVTMDPSISRMKVDGNTPLYTPVTLPMLPCPFQRRVMLHVVGIPSLSPDGHPLDLGEASQPVIKGNLSGRTVVGTEGNLVLRRGA